MDRRRIEMDRGGRMKRKEGRKIGREERNINGRINTWKNK